MGHAHTESQAHTHTHTHMNSCMMLPKNAALSHLNAPRILRVSCSAFLFFLPFFRSQRSCCAISFRHLFSFAAIFGAVLHILAIICIIDDCDAAAAVGTSDPQLNYGQVGGENCFLLPRYCLCKGLWRKPPYGILIGPAKR